MTTITVAARPETAADAAAPPDPRWARPGLLALLAATAVLYLWGLGSSGWANSYYAAAAQAGTQDWKAWLFGSLDAGNAITVDKPPAAMWVMALSGRLFGFNAFTMLLPQALMGVAAVAVLYFTVKRSSGAGAGLIAGAVLALTPVATLMFRYNNPDALLVLLLVVAAYCTVRAIENGSMRWMALTGCVVGFAFLTKMLQAFLIVPGLALAFLFAAPTGWWRRLGALLVGGATMILSAGWYIAMVSLWPAASRPFIAGSTDNSLLQLALGYNGIERIVGGGGPAGGGPGGGHGPGRGGIGAGNIFFGGEPGIGRMFGMSFGTEASWLLPAALIGLLAGIWLTWRTARTGQVRAGLLLWGGWLLVTGAVFSFMDGTVHPYYTVALAPAIAALVGISVAELLRRKAFLAAAPDLGRHVGGDRGVGVRAAEPDPGLVACAALDGAGRIGDRGGACRRPAPAGSRHRRRRRGGCPVRARRHGRLLDRDHVAGSQRADDHVRAGKGGWFRLRRPWRQGRSGRQGRPRWAGKWTLRFRR